MGGNGDPPLEPKPPYDEALVVARISTDDSEVNPTYGVVVSRWMRGERLELVTIHRHQALAHAAELGPGATVVRFYVEDNVP